MTAIFPPRTMSLSLHHHARQDAEDTPPPPPEKDAFSLPRARLPKHFRFRPMHGQTDTAKSSRTTADGIRARERHILLGGPPAFDFEGAASAAAAQSKHTSAASLPSSGGGAAAVTTGTSTTGTGTGTGTGTRTGTTDLDLDLDLESSDAATLKATGSSHQYMYHHQSLPSRPAGQRPSLSTTMTLGMNNLVRGGSKSVFGRLKHDGRISPIEQHQQQQQHRHEPSPPHQKKQQQQQRHQHQHQQHKPPPPTGSHPAPDIPPPDRTNLSNGICIGTLSKQHHVSRSIG
jgi:hypothetical protein